MKKLICMILVMMLTSTVFVCAQQEVRVYVNGELLNSDQSAIVYEDRTMVPLRAICEALNCNVVWDEAGNTVIIKNEVTMVAMIVGSPYITVKDRRIGDDITTPAIPIPVPPMIVNGRTLVPARAIAEALNAVVLWNEYTNSVEITLEYDYISAFNEVNENGMDIRLAEVKKDGKFGYINENREIVVDVIYDHVGGFVDGYAPAQKNDKWGCVDANGNEVIPFEYDLMWGFSEGFSVVGKNKKFGVINRYGDVVVPIVYDIVDDFSEKMTRVMSDGKWGYVNTEGVVVIPFVYDNAGRFHEGKAQVEQNGKTFYIDTTGKIIN